MTEAKRDYFLIRLWDADELLGALFDVYDELPGDVKSALPLKRVWALVQED